MIKQISLIALVAIGIGALFLTSIAPAFATVPLACTRDPHGPGSTGDPHVGGGTGNAHYSFECPGAK